MIKLDCVETFVAIAETGSMTRAAGRLTLSKSVISERLADLERTLEAKLVHRTTRTLSLTDDGAAFYQRAKGILRDVDRAANELVERRGTLAGKLRVSAPVSFGSLHLSPALCGFLAEHPAVELTLELEDRFVDLLAEGYDAVVRHGPVDDKRIIVKKLAASRRVLVASPDYLKRAGIPRSVADLEAHRGILYTYRGAADWRFRTGRQSMTVRPGVALMVNNGIVMREAAIAGLGIALLPRFILDVPHAERSLNVIDVGAEAEGATVYIAYPEHLRSSAKIRALAAWLQRSFANTAHWDKPSGAFAGRTHRSTKS